MRSPSAYSGTYDLQLMGLKNIAQHLQHLNLTCQGNVKGKPYARLECHGAVRHIAVKHRTG